MGKKGKNLSKGRLDKYYYLAKEQGYRSRAAFKLIQLNKKYNFLNTARAVLDLCAAPGGWLQVAHKYMPVSSVLIGVDLAAIKPVGNAVLLQQDITTAKCRAEIKKSLHGWKVDVVLHDGAPNMGLAWAQDAFSQSELVLSSLKLATEFLKEGGYFITKVFRSNDYNSLIWVFNQLFKKVEATKPQASRNASAEIFVVCQGYLEPAQIDPKLLDSKYVFKEVEEQTKAPNVFGKQPRKPSRVGYESGELLLKKASVQDFIRSKDPVAMLAVHHLFEFDEESQIYKEQKATTPEILELCADLKVLGKMDFKRLLKWRTSMIQATKMEEEEEESEEEEEEEKELTPEEEEEKLNKELKAQIATVQHRKKKEHKKELKKKKKLAEKLQLKIVLPSDIIEQQDDLHMFKLNSIKSNDDMKKLDSVNINNVMDEVDDEDEEEDDAFEQEDDFVSLDKSNDPVREDDDDDEEDEEAYEDEMENMLDEQYQIYMEKKKNRAQKKREAKTMSDDEEEDDSIIKDKKITTRIKGYEPKVSGNIISSDEEDSDEDIDDEDLKIAPKPPKQRGNDLIMEEDDEQDVTTSKKASMWFSQFKSINEDDDEDMEIQKMKKKLLQEANKKRARDVKEAEEDEDSEDEEYRKKKELKLKKKEEEAEFEVVPRREYEEAEESEDDLTEEQKATALVIGQKMLNNPHLKDDLIDNLYNRYAFNDGELPKWFIDDEESHNKPQAPITKAEIEEMKQKLKELNARPIKKIAEAKARKKMRLAKKLEGAKTAAEAIAKNDDIAPADKMKAIEKIYKKTKRGQKKKVVLVVNRKSGGNVAKGTTRTRGSRLKLVDSRMRKDMRNQKRKNKKR